MLVIILDETHHVIRRAQKILGAAVSDTIAVETLDALGPPLAAAGVDDILLARVSSKEHAQQIARLLHETRFPGRTFLLVAQTEQVGLEHELSLPRTETLEFSATRLDDLLRRLSGGPSSTIARVRAPRQKLNFHGIVGQSKQIQDVVTRIEKAAAGDANVCIYGESGTGKELIARAIHELSDRRHRPLVTFDAAAVPEGLAESQLFGHVRGAFTGAIENRDGVFSQADTGTLFIDELCELSLPLQAKLLRVIQSREFVKVGGTKPIRTNIRLVTATNKDPKKAADAGTFRSDLYYRVAVVMIKTPPLRERREDIPLLVEHFLERYSEMYKKPIRGIQPSAIDRMMTMPWPGNIRQLENFLAQAVVMAEGDLLTERDLFLDEPSPTTAIAPSVLQLEPGLPLREVERRYILRTLQRAYGNRTEAAKILGISVRCLQYKLKAYAQGIDPVVPANGSDNGNVIVPPVSRTQILAS